MINPLITTGPNFKFIQSSFIEAKLALNKYRDMKNDPLIPLRELRQFNEERLKGIGLEGASRTGKDWDSCVFICHYITSYQGKKVNLCRGTLKDLKDTLYETLKGVWELFGLPLRHFNKTATAIYFNGNVIKFVGVNDNIMKAHGLESDLLLVSETMEISKETKNQLEQRVKEFFIYNYNPSATDHHIYKLELRKDYYLLKTTIFDNDYAPENAKQKILSYAHPEVDDYHIVKKYGWTKEDWYEFKQRNLQLETANVYLWEVYGLGHRAAGEDAVFDNIHVYDKEPEDYDWKLYGGDFGYTTDPTVIIDVRKDGNNLYIRQKLRETRLMNPDIATNMLEMGLTDVVSCWDSAGGGKDVDELGINGIPAEAAEKPPGSKAWGLTQLQKYSKIYLWHEDKEMIKEFTDLKWLKDSHGNYKKNTFNQRIPIDGKDHAVDAASYANRRYLGAMNLSNNGNN